MLGKHSYGILFLDYFCATENHFSLLNLTMMRVVIITQLDDG